MEYRGQVRNGVVVLNDPGALPDGIAVHVSVAPQATTSPSAAGIQSGEDSSPNIETRFNELLRLWKQATLLTSSTTEQATHPAYQQIIGLGQPAIPLILNELRREPDHWFWALKAITGEDPVATADRGNVPQMTAAWLAWAQRHGF